MRFAPRSAADPIPFMPKSVFRNPQSAFRVPYSAFRNPCSVFGIRIPRSACRIPQSAFRNPHFFCNLLFVVRIRRLEQKPAGRSSPGVCYHRLCRSRTDQNRLEPGKCFSGLRRRFLLCGIAVIAMATASRYRSARDCLPSFSSATLKLCRSL